MINLSFVGRDLNRGQYLTLIQDLPKPLLILGSLDSDRTWALDLISTKSKMIVKAFWELSTHSGDKRYVDAKAFHAHLSLGVEVWIGDLADSHNITKWMKPKSILIIHASGFDEWNEHARRYRDGLDKNLPASGVRHQAKMLSLESSDLEDRSNSRAWRVLIEASTNGTDSIFIMSGAILRSESTGKKSAYAHKKGGVNGQ